MRNLSCMKKLTITDITHTYHEKDGVDELTQPKSKVAESWPSYFIIFFEVRHPRCVVSKAEFLCITHTVEHNYISLSSTVGIQLHVSFLYVGHLQVVIQLKEQLYKMCGVYHCVTLSDIMILLLEFYELHWYIIAC